MRAVLALLVLCGGLASPLYARQQTDTTFAVEPRGRLRIDNHEGAVRVRAWDRPAMRVVAVHSSRIWIDIRQSAGGVRLEGEARRGPAHGIAYDVTVPRSYSVNVDVVNSNVLVQDVDGEIVVDNVQGEIVTRGGRGRLQLDAVNGDVTVTGARGRVVVDANNGNVRVSDIIGDVGVDANNGNIRLSDIRGDVSIDAVSGEIQLSNIEANSVGVETVSGSIQYQGSLRNVGRYSLSTHNGNIRVAIPEGAGATVSVSTHNGDVEADFPVEVRGALQQGRMSFVLGNGGARLDLESFNGTIQLVRPR